MTVVLMVLGLGLAVETILFHVPHIWKSQRLRVVLSGLLTLQNTFIAAIWVMNDFSVISALFGFFTLYKVLNFLRIAHGRMHEKYLYYATRRTTLWLTIAYVACVGVWYLDSVFVFGTTMWITGLLIAQAVVATALFLNTLRTLSKTRIDQIEPTGAHSPELPSVTIAVPARNETDELEDFLHHVIKSDYPKLEILVLDDCSQLKRTPAIIRDFAHAGVRFLQGTPPDENWTAKNHAYAQLADQANSQLVLFCGVDVRFQPHTVRQLVSTLLQRNKRMVSVMPLRDNRSGIQWSLVQAGRYLWEMAPPRRFFNRPAVLSSCWMIYRSDLLNFGGFAAVTRSVTPEAYFARQTVATSDGYSFLRADTASGLTSVKSHSSQRSTAIRTRYPALKRRPEFVALTTLLELFFILSTFLFAGLGLLGYLSSHEAFIAVSSALLLSATYAIVTINTRVNSWYIALIWPFLSILTDIAVMHRSMWQYEFSEVIWKDRNVCLPAMHIVPSLPKD